MTEEWRPVTGTNGKYLVSNTGKVYSTRSGITLKPRPIKHGYLRVNLPAESRTKRDVYIHRLVAEAFCERREGCDVVNHIDNDTQNNHASNLEWVRQFDNVYHGMKQNRYRLNARSVVGTKGNESRIFASTRQAEAITGCDHSAIAACCRGKHKTTHGYTWKYAEVV